ncbi:MAG TPA: 3-carboxyethylcatechol 2,3-dioxygenase [Xanthobacteraceae bacterium]|nr:3-carboxyethylcatechol 2,3-dioxygenase [Xanthobacteraceae bacterium]
MAVQLICCSHSPLMVTGIEESEQNVQAQFFKELDGASAALHAFRPDLVVVFGPDHFNGFFYELMPAFCIGTAAEGSKDWHLESGPLRVPQELATACIRFLQSRDFDVAISHQMKVDHGITIPLLKLTGALARYDVLPIFVNCAADPRPSFRRVRRFGEAVGEFFAGRDLRVTVVGSGGLSHDPPTPRLNHSPPDVARRLIVRQTPSQDELDARENRVIKAARDLLVGKGPCLPPSEQWDRDFLHKFLSDQLEDFDRMTDDEIDRVAGFGAHEVRTWVAAAAAARGIGNPRSELRYYHLVPEWITGMAIVVAQ